MTWFRQLGPEIQNDVEAIMSITDATANDLDVISVDLRLYVVDKELEPSVLKRLAEAGYEMDVDECPFGYCTDDFHMKTGIDSARADRGPYGILTPSYGITDPVAAAQARAAGGNPQVAVNNLGRNVPANFMGQSFRDAISSDPSTTAVQSNVAHQVNAMNVMEIAAQFLLGGGLLCAVLAK